jgi:predicted dithiol-disulfide oxidoreductase (DUF899 family)
MEYLHYPNESAEYRAARNALLDDEIALRKQIEAVAAKDSLNNNCYDSAGFRGLIV